ncbi:MAG: bifunctional oligoribonuclease/PAP phosphatase NrnA [Actinobacteria bacterium]|nr:bifunctional oligoribonuclease/PAP phosphatase NrnA [Actinomycetota bacterium]MCG2819156.1 bifunctional oligoribonuclease/PAP phosphatase NrnA [Actinomycetes bacterium]MBU4179033.1 bifunctional oligoribonuclease/PAP phosphatase NrnA [Actinomycetota bacterium]MBU4219025.1 bifunctional oligoribonuclease/PAP phosphatase NrnA [Actinomycetota bacterium]MBU4359213.1 bifunctional oligoribonuclease/PAP phosphatase NrnA [Actinomycetota bacterium]
MGINRGEVGRANRLIEESDSVVVLSHQNPDGDAFGSVLGLGLMLRGAGLNVKASWPDPVELPLKYEFLPGKELLISPADLRPQGLVIAVDCANAGRLGELEDAVLKVDNIINIDHHPDNSLFGTVNLVDAAASATTEILYEEADDLGLELDRDIAVCLYTGLVTDTGRFQFSNTSAETFRIASELVEMGAEPNRLYEEIFQGDTLSYMRLTGEMVSRAVFEPETGLVHVFMPQEELRRFGVEMNETEDLIDSLRTLRGHRIAALFKEQDDGRIRVSLRSRADTDIGTVARSLGGGGHRVAAGYTSEKGSFEEALQELKGEIVAP